VALTRDQIALTDSVSGVSFDLNADGVAERCTWTEPGKDDAFLVLDRNANGLIDNGTELFGTATSQPFDIEKNGFAALAVFDTLELGGNNDLKITVEDSVFSELRLWVDSNHDGVSQPLELQTLPDLGFTGIDLDYRRSSKQDRYGNEFRYRSKVYFDGNGNVSKYAYDVFLMVVSNE